MHGSVRREWTVLDRDAAGLLRGMLLIERVGRRWLLVLFSFSQLILLMVESLKNCGGENEFECQLLTSLKRSQYLTNGTSVALQVLVLLVFVQVNHLSVQHQRRRRIAEATSVSVQHHPAAAAAILTRQRWLVRLLLRLSVRERRRGQVLEKTLPQTAQRGVLLWAAVQQGRIDDRRGRAGRGICVRVHHHPSGQKGRLFVLAVAVRQVDVDVTTGATTNYRTIWLQFKILSLRCLHLLVLVLL